MGNGERRRGIRVVVIGAGVGGLSLARGLRNAGLHVQVYEQESQPWDDRPQGYRLHIGPEEEEPLRECLPESARDLLVAPSNGSFGFGMACYDEQLNPEAPPELDGPWADSAYKVHAIDRADLRHVLLEGLEREVRFGMRLTHFTSGPESGLVAHFADGSQVESDVLIAADGVDSRLRQQCGVDIEPADLGVRTVFGRVPMTRVLCRVLPEVLRDRFTWVSGSTGHALSLLPMVLRSRMLKECNRRRTGRSQRDTDDYIMAAFSMHRTALGSTDDEFVSMDHEGLWELVRRRTAGWHPLLRATLRYVSVPETFPVADRATIPVEPWPVGGVIPIGDAVHAMPASSGVGAHVAIRDASVLTRALVAVDRGELTIAEASKTYQEQMVSYATEALGTSLRIVKCSLRAIDVDETALFAESRGRRGAAAWS